MQNVHAKPFKLGGNSAVAPCDSEMSQPPNETRVFICLCAKSCVTDEEKKTYFHDTQLASGQ